MNIVDVGGALFFASSGATGEVSSAADLAVNGAAPTPVAPLSASPTAAASTADANSPPTAATQSAASGPAKRAYPAPAETPTQQGPHGIRFDFNDGCRVVLPEAAHPWKVRLSDIDTGNILFETEIKAGRVNSTKRYFVRIRLEVWSEGKSVLKHDYSAAGRDVLIQLPVGTLGDPMGWFPYAVKFKELHGCNLTCLISEKLIPLFKPAYPDITFATHEEHQPDRYYATYSLGLFFDDKDFMFQPSDFRHVGLHRTAAYILGVDPTEVAPRIALEDDTRPLA
jgi:autotransporter strand-loop-strand O-heptosyltransferase